MILPLVRIELETSAPQLSLRLTSHFVAVFFQLVRSLLPILPLLCVGVKSDEELKQFTVQTSTIYQLILGFTCYIKLVA